MGPTEASLELERRKPRWLALTLAYRAMRVARAVVGRKRLLRFGLDASWIVRRLTFELSGDMLGEAFHCETMALSGEILKPHVSERSTVIDIGCGTGRWCREASNYVRSVVGVDMDPEKVRAARRLSKSDNITYIVGDATALMSGADSAKKFDAALLIHVLEHIDDVDGFLTSLHSVARMLVIEVPDFDNDALNVVRQQLGRPFYSDADHVREYTRDILRDQLTRNAWSIRHEERWKGSIVTVASD